MRPRSGNRKEQLIQEATRLFAKVGYKGMTMKRLAHACGISEPALYRHFPSKEALYVSVLHSLADRVAPDKLFTRLAKETEVKKLLEALARHILHFYSRHKELYRLLLYSALSGHHEAAKAYEAIREPYIRFLKEQLDRLYRDGHIIKKNNEITARCFVGMVFDCSLSTTLWKRYDRKTYRPDQVIRNNIPIYVRGLQRTPLQNEE
jgi:AcrR family transcriptional regulator